MMKNNSLYKFCFATAITLILMFSTSCSSDELSNESGLEQTSPEDADKLLNKATTEWGLSREDIILHMKGYRQLSNTEHDILQFTVPNSRQSISYLLHNDKLFATAIIMPLSYNKLDLQSLISGYKYLGTLSDGEIYENRAKNTMATVWQSFKNDSTFSAIGFAQISSDDYETIQPVNVTTKDNVKTEMFTATVSGSVSGTEKSTEVGFIYGTNSNLSEIYDKKVSTTSHDDFTLNIKGLIDDKTYYYCAYAMIDNIYYLGEIKSFKTQPLTYTIDGQTYKMITVESSDMDDFSIMQTELPVNSDLNIGGVLINKLNTKDDGGVIKSEFRTFLNSLREATGIQFRLPTSEEWEYAAHGGNKSKDYTYSGSNIIDEVAWYKDNSNNKAHGIAEKEPNELGLYDMSGNHSELCNDSQDEYNVDGTVHGGSWNDTASNCKWSSKKNGSVSGKIPGTNLKELNAFNSKYITIRLVYTRQ